MIKLRVQPSSSSPKNKVAREDGRAGRGGGDGRAGGGPERRPVRGPERRPVRGPEGWAGKRTGRRPVRGPGGGSERGPEGGAGEGPGRGSLPTGLRHGDQPHRYSSGIPAWRRGSSGRSLARGPCPQVLEWHPRVAKGKEIGTVDVIMVKFATGFGTATLPTDTSVAFRRGEGVFCTVSIRSFIDDYAGLRHSDPTHRYLRGILAWRGGSSDRSSPRSPNPQVPQWHSRVAKHHSTGLEPVFSR